MMKLLQRHIFISFIDKRSSGISPALVSAITLGAALAVSLVGFTTVTVLLIKSKTKTVQTIAATQAAPDRITSETVENTLVHDITTSENIAYVVHL
jgi:hypothetical protein